MTNLSTARVEPVKHRRRVCTVIALAALVVGGVACGSDDSSSGTDASTAEPTSTVASTAEPTSTVASTGGAASTVADSGPAGSSSTELCDAADELKASLADLASVEVVKNGTSAITDALDEIKDDLTAVRSAAGSDMKPDVDAFQQSVDELQTVVAASGTPPISDVVSGVRDVATNGATLLTSLGNAGCS